MKKNLSRKDIQYLLHTSIDEKDLNSKRLSFINELKKEKINICIAQELKEGLSKLLGPDMAIQKNVNLTIQVPNSTEGILDFHTDTWCGNSHFEIGIWIPFTNCYESKSMYIVDKKESLEIWDNYINKGLKLSDIVLKDKNYLDIKEGEVLLFSPNLIHGSDVNKTSETRVSLNFRAKSLFTPFEEKRMAEYFEVFSMGSVSKLAYEFKEGTR